MISLVDLISLCVLPIGALIFFAIFYFIRGQWWWALLSGLLWILFGYNSITSAEVFNFQRELGIVWIVVGIAVIWMPAYWKKGKQDKTLMEMAEEGDDISEHKKWLKEHDEEVAQHRGLGRRKRPKEYY